MLQKILVVIVGIVMSLVGALSPAGIFASEPAVEIGAMSASAGRDEPLATVRTADGSSSAKVNVLWAEVDGHRVTDDAWGTGAVDHMRFKVGVKGVEGLALAVGDRMVSLHPTDVLTIRMFRGEFAFRDMGTSSATLQLQGSIKSALVSGGEANARIRTEIPGSAGPSVIEPPQGGAREVSYVVLDTGQKVETLSVADGGSRLFTEESLALDAAQNVPGNLLAKWVRIDGKFLQEYTWGDGPVSTIEFEPANAGKGGVVLAYNDAPTEAAAGSRVLVRDFVGEYLVYQVEGGMLRLRLDGYAEAMELGAAVSLPIQTGEGAPIASFEYAPSNPKTTDTIRFTDRSSDDTLVVLRLWRFGDEGSSVLPNPTHRFTTPGAYVVTLNVTDTDRQQSETSLIITVGNAEPVPDFDFWPKIVTTQTMVAFTDESTDTDGSITSYAWDFGDGDVSDDRNPIHKFNASGAITVTLTTTDNLGGVSSISKIIDVRNTPPLARFNYSPNDIMTLVPVQFQDNSEDSDGVVVHREWKFGDGSNATGAAPVHVYGRPGLYTVSLTATDNAGDSDTTTTQLSVRNRLPIVDFAWTPNGSPADRPVHFTSLATDPDGTILIYEWNFGDGTSAVEPNPTHFFQRSGNYNVTLTVTDNSLERNSTTILVGIANALPRAAFAMNPNPAFRGADITLADTSTDPDGDQIVNRTWRIAGEDPIYDLQIVHHTFTVSGEYPVSLTVRDSAGSEGMASSTLRVVNRPPVIDNVTVSPDFAAVDAPVRFNASGRDLDAQPSDPPLTYEWRFSDGPVLMGAEVERIFNAPGRITATVRATDSEGAVSNPLTTVVNVDFAVPNVVFTWTPGPPSAVPSNNDPIQFQSSSSSLNGPITTTRWDFKDGTTADGLIVNHTYARGGTYLVRLTVTDNRSRTNSLELPVIVNSDPTPAFEFQPGGIIPRDSPVSFSDHSSDTDGDAITSWSWDFGDGGFSNEQHPTHNFSIPGRHNVTLSVTDARGATGTLTKNLRIANERPVARWTAPTGAVAGEAASFLDNSFDPDGTPILAWSWNFGDASTSVLQNPSHVFAASGRYTVSLVVNDGELSSRVEPGAYQIVRVLANHDAPADIRARLPDGRTADLPGGAYTVTARLNNGPEIPLLVPNGTSYQLTLERATWMRGDALSVTITAPTYFTGSLQKVWTLGDADGLTRAVAFDFEIPMPLVATVLASPGELDTTSTIPFVVRNDDYTIENDPVYRSMAEPFRGNGTIRFRDGQTVVGATVVMEARYLPIRAIGSIRDALGLADTALLGWCRAATVLSGADGVFEWVMDARSDCAFQEAGVHPVGRWEVRAKASYTFAEPTTSATKTIYVDPTGGLLWSVAAPP